MIKKLEKAIRHFECMRDDNIVVLNSGFGTKKGEHNSLYKNRKMYAELAIEALEKQIPKIPKNIKVLGEPFFEDEVIVKYGDCAICGFDVHSDISEYCPNCGNRIDWSEADD